VTVAIDLEVDAARPWIEGSGAEHPQLVDTTHSLDELLGIINVPMAVWVDEEGTIVRPPEVAVIERSEWADIEISDDWPAVVRDMLEQVKRIPRYDPERYADALRDWTERGAASPFALTPAEVVARSAPRPIEEAEAVAQFELGQHLHHAGFEEDARTHFREAHRLHPDNWTYKRNAWELLDPGTQGPSDAYDGDWLSDIKRLGPERYYPPLEL
jgi:hypothetical protein